MNWSVFLESADADHVDSQWSIISASPIATLQSFSGTTYFKQGNLCEQQSSDPFALLKCKREELFGLQQTNVGDYPFTGGILGSIDYELGYQFESINNSAHPKALSLPELSLGFYDWALLHDRKRDLFYLAIHNTSSTTMRIEEQWQKRFQWLMQQTHDKMCGASFMLSGEWQSNMDKQQYTDKFNKVQSYILSGDCYQVNLAQRFSAPYQGDEYQAYQRLIAQNRPPFAAFLRLPEQIILSLSPERFLKLQNGVVESKPIKGTRPRFDDPLLDLESQQQLQASEKDRSENLMIVDLLRNDIGRVCQPGSVKVPSLFDIESFPAVHHLVSTVVGKLDPQYQVEDLLRASFPGGSITGAPKIRAMEIIAELEEHRRHSYCGSIGYINADGQMDMNIAIRTLICVDGHIYCWAGGGLVADSEANAEYQECFDKLSKILPCLYQKNY
ncbi:aminodeoxychorismate synthase, component I [Psychromonas marina]|uniref:aminodeoxychorismate synthase n=1 Tax=Psychromonas marina TaxID=88364 RepID=A0ABQ6E298_9GAMM|nr:aminodeoxychorismate synthase, component I [Psychromonas marina]